MTDTAASAIILGLMKSSLMTCALPVLMHITQVIAMTLNSVFTDMSSYKV
jgi:hypothetical protein